MTSYNLKYQSSSKNEFIAFINIGKDGGLLKVSTKEENTYYCRLCLGYKQPTILNTTNKPLNRMH